MLGNIEIPLAPLPEQKRIADKLDTLLARIDACRDRLDRIPKIIKQFRQSVLAAATSGHLTEDWRAAQADRVARMQPQAESELVARDAAQCRYEVTPTPDSNARHPGYELPWRNTNMGECGQVSGGLTKNPKRDNLALRKPYLRVANVYANSLDLDELQEIGLTAQEWQKTKLEAGDLLIVEGNGSLDQIGRVALWSDEVQECSHQNHIIRWRTRGELLPKFSLYWLLSPEGRTSIEEIARTTTGLHTLSITKVASLSIRLPSIPEQSEIVRRVESLFALADGLEARVATARARVASLTPATLAKAFRGELVPQDPNDEPASILLERIRAERAAKPPERRGRRGPAKAA